MTFMKNYTIKSKIIIMNMIITLTLVSVAFIIFSISEINHQRTVLINNVRFDTKILKEAIYASLDFDYKKDAEKILFNMSIKPYLNDYIIFDKKGDFFVSHTDKKYKTNDFDFKDNNDNYFLDNYFYYRSDIFNKENIKVGSIYTIISTKIYKDQIASYVNKLILLLILVFILSFLLSSIMQRFISKPIMDLAKTTKDIRDKENFDISVTYESKDAIGTLYKNFNEMIDALKIKEIERKKAKVEQDKLQLQLQQSQKMEAVGQLAGGIAHDFNNILTAINGYADLALIKVKDDKPLSKMLTIIRESGRRASNLTKQLLTFSRKQIIEIKTITLNDTITKMQDMLLRIIEEDTSLIVDCEQDCFIDADKGQIEQIIMNLVVNARDAIRLNINSKKKKTINLESKIVEIDNNMRTDLKDLKPGKHVLFSVSDSGVGMDLETKSKIFEPFFTTKPRGKGTGLGLATVYGIVKQNKGIIYVYSELNQGTTFKIYWPLSKKKVQVTDTYKKIKTGNIIGGNEKILIVEDDKEVLGFASNTLSIMGYEIFKANNGEEALEVAKKHNYIFDLILSDVIMPGISGPEFIDIYKKYDKNIKVLFTSGYTFDLIVQDGIVKKDINFINKPYNTTELSIKIRELLDLR